MSVVEGSRTFRAGGTAYDRFMGRNSKQLVARLGSPAGPFTLQAAARCAIARVPA